MSEEKKKYPAYPQTINSADIKDPVGRWVCQRLDHLYEILTELLVEVREVNSLLHDIQKAVYEK